MMYFIAAIQSLTILAAWLLIEDGPKTQNLEASKPETGQLLQSQPKPKFFSVKVLLSPAYFTFIIAIVLYLAGYFGTIINLKSLYATYGLSNAEISRLFFVSGIIELIARLIYAFVLVDACCKIKLLAGTCVGEGLSFLALCLPVLTLFRSHTTQIIWIGVTFYSIFSSGWSGLMSAVVPKITQPQDFAVASGMYIFITGNANSLGPIISGIIVDYLRESQVENSTQLILSNKTFSIYEDPYWAPIFVGSTFLMIPGGLLLLALKLWH